MKYNQTHHHIYYWNSKRRCERKESRNNTWANKGWKFPKYDKGQEFIHARCLTDSKYRHNKQVVSIKIWKKNALKDTLKILNNPQNGGKYFQIVYMIGIHIQNIQRNPSSQQNKRQTMQFKDTKGTCIDISLKKIERWLISPPKFLRQLVIRALQMKTTMRYH